MKEGGFVHVDVRALKIAVDQSFRPSVSEWEGPVMGITDCVAVAPTSAYSWSDQAIAVKT
jgi:hypothetical protein